MKKIITYLTAFFCFLIVSAPWVLQLLYGDASLDKAEGNLGERGELAEYPESFSDTYLLSLGDAYRDHSPARGRIILWKNNISQKSEAAFRDSVIAKLTQLLMKPTQPSRETDPTPAETEAGTLPESSTENDPADPHHYVLIRTQEADETHYGYEQYYCPHCRKYRYDFTAEKTTSTAPLVVQYSGDVILGRNHWLFYRHSTDDYTGSNLLSPEALSAWQNTFEQLQKKCDERGIRLVILEAPNKNVVYREYFPTNLTPGNPTRAMQLRQALKDSPVIFLYPLEAEREAARYYDSYYMMDTHWNEYGALTAIQEVYKTLGLPAESIEDWETELEINQNGDLSLMTGLHPLYETPIIRYHSSVKNEFFGIPDNAVTAGDPEECCFYTSDSENSQKIMVVGDSYRNQTKRIFSRDFAKASFFHCDELKDRSHESFRQLCLSLDELGEGDVLLLISVERFADNLPQAAQSLIELMS